MTGSFTGFTPDAMQFLVDLAFNNERPWFQAHKADYERLLKEPLEAMCADLGDELAKRGVPLQRRSQVVALPHLPRHALLEGQVAVQDESSRQAFRGSAMAPRRATANRSATAAATSTCRRRAATWAAGCGIPEPARLAAFRKAVDEDPDDALGALEDPCSWRASSRSTATMYKRVPGAMRPTTRRPTCCA